MVMDVTKEKLCSKTSLEQEHMWAGLDCVRGDLIGLLWFTIG